MIKLLRGAWRADLAEVAESAKHSVLVAAPFIKEREAAWLCDRMRPRLAVTTLTNINVEAISSAALDVAALRRLAEASELATLVALPILHAKVFVADEKTAIVTSGNLTTAAMDRNAEYGVLIDDEGLVPTIRSDMLAFAKLGSVVSHNDLDLIGSLESRLRESRAKADKGIPEARRELAEIVRQAHPEFVAAQVGSRSKHAVFGDAIRFLLARGPMRTVDMHESIRTLLPDLCDDSKPLIIRGKPYGKAWKHDIRNAQFHLKRRGVLALDKQSGLWSLALTQVGRRTD